PRRDGPFLRGGGGPFMRPGEWRREFPRSYGPDEPISDEKWKQIEELMKKYSPQRWERLQEVPEDRRDDIRRAMARRYDLLERLKEQEPAVYDLRLKRLAIEDQIFT